MPASVTDLLLGRGAAVAREHVVLACFDAEIDPTGNEEQATLVLAWDNGRVSSHVLDWYAIAVAPMRDPAPHIVVLGRSGQAAVITSTGVRTEVFDQSDDGPPGRGAMRDATSIGPELWAVGMSRQVYRRVVVGADPDVARWEKLDRGLLPALDAPTVAGFDAVHGFSPEDVYAVGWQGELRHRDSSGWWEPSHFTNVKLQRVLCAPDGIVYAAGQHGVLLRGRGVRWEVVEHGVTRAAFWGIAWFAGHVWLATLDSVFRLDGDALTPVPLADEEVTARTLTVAEGQLWSIGAQHVFRTDDGARWRQLTLQP